MKHRYMVITYFKKPNGKWDEITEFKNSVKSKHLQEAKVILDFREKRIIKNGLNTEATFEDTLELYKRLLGDKLKPYLDQQSP